MATMGTFLATAVAISAAAISTRSVDIAAHGCFVRRFPGYWGKSELAITIPFPRSRYIFCCSCVGQQSWWRQPQPQHHPAYHSYRRPLFGTTIAVVTVAVIRLLAASIIGNIATIHSPSTPPFGGIAGQLHCWWRRISTIVDARERILGRFERSSRGQCWQSVRSRLNVDVGGSGRCFGHGYGHSTSVFGVINPLRCWRTAASRVPKHRHVQ